MGELLEGKERRPLLLLGSGHTARSFAMVEKELELGNQGILISSRSEDRANALAVEVGATTVPWEHWARAVDSAAVVVSALAGGELAWTECKGNGPELLLDLGVPRTLTALRRAFPQSKWVDLEELARRSEVMPESLGAIHRAEEVLRNHETYFAMQRTARIEKVQAFRG
jgi:glutamyl-tRNA reductase